MLCSHRRISVIADAVHFYWFGRSGQYSSWWCLCCDQSCRCTRNYNDEKRKHYNVIVKITKNKFKVWYAAVTQSFFSLSVGFGTLTTYSSYNKVPAYIYNISYITHIMAIIEGDFFTNFTNFLNVSPWEGCFIYSQQIRNMRLKTNRFMSVLP